MPLTDIAARHWPFLELGLLAFVGIAELSQLHGALAAWPSGAVAPGRAPAAGAQVSGAWRRAAANRCFSLDLHAPALSSNTTNGSTCGGSTGSSYVFY